MRDADLTVKQVTLWVCDVCGYYRSDKTTGRHTTDNPKDPRGPLLAHTLRPVKFVRAPRTTTETEDA